PHHVLRGAARRLQHVSGGERSRHNDRRRGIRDGQPCCARYCGHSQSEHQAEGEQRSAATLAE
nr:hypothetical protein [Tanacetum cinerariifolium]